MICNESQVFVLAYDVCNKLHSPLLTEAYLSKQKIKEAHNEISKQNEEYIEQNNALDEQLFDLNTKYMKAR